MTHCSLAFSILGAIDLTKSQFFPDKYQHWQIVTYFPLWSWKAWFSIVCLLSLIAVWLGSFNRDADKNVEIEELQNALPILSIDIKEIFIIPSRRSDVFVLASVRNDSKTETLIESYRLVLNVESPDPYHLDGPLTDTSSYSRMEMDWLETPHIVSKSQLVDFSSQISRKDPLKYGLPVTGWLHFRVESGSDLPDLRMEMIKKAVLCMRDSCANSLIHTTTKQGHLDNPHTQISQTGVFV